MMLGRDYSVGEYDLYLKIILKNNFQEVLSETFPKKNPNLLF